MKEEPSNITMKVLRRKADFLLCPYCSQNIPSIAFKSSKGTISLNCVCTLESKELSITEYMASLQQSLPSKAECGLHRQPQEKYCMDCSKWLCQECLRQHAYTTSQHDCLLDYMLPIRCNQHRLGYSHYCKLCFANICPQCKGSHFNHHLVEVKPVHISPYQNDNELFRKIIDGNKEKASRLLFKINYQINKLSNEILALNKMKEEVMETVKANEDIMNHMIDYIECLCNTSLALGKYSCYALMNNFNALAIPNNTFLYDDENKDKDKDIDKDKDKDKDIDKDKDKDNDSETIEETFHQLKTVLLNPFVVRYQCKATLSGHLAYVDHLIQSSDSNNKDVLASSSGDKTIRFWNVESMKCETTSEKQRGFIYQLIKLSDGQLASRSNDEVIKLWSPSLFKCNGVLIGHTDYIHDIKELSDGQLVSCSADNTIKLWNVASQHRNGTLSGHQGQVREVIEITRGILASRSDDKSIRIWNIEAFECKGAMEGFNGFIREMVVSVNDQMAFRSDDNDVHLWNMDVMSAQKERSLVGHSDLIEQLLSLSDGQLASLGKDDQIRLWSVREFKCNGVLKGHSAYIRQMLQLADGQLLSYSDDMSIKLWNVTTLKCNATLKGHTGAINHVTILNDEQIASCSEDYTIRLWTVTRTQMRDYSNKPDQKRTSAIVESKIKALSSGTGANANGGNEDRENAIKSNATLAGHTGFVYNVIQLSNGDIASCSSDTTIKLWHI